MVRWVVIYATLYLSVSTLMWLSTRAIASVVLSLPLHRPFWPTPLNFQEFRGVVHYHLLRREAHLLQLLRIRCGHFGASYANWRRI